MVSLKLFKLKSPLGVPVPVDWFRVTLDVSAIGYGTQLQHALDRVVAARTLISPGTAVVPGTGIRCAEEQCCSRFLAMPSIPGKARSTFLAARPLGQRKARISHPVSRVFCSARSRSRAHNKGEIPIASPCPRRLFIAVPPIRVSIRQSRLNLRRRRGGSPVDFLCLEGLVRMAVSLHGDQLAYPASARGIALAVENKIHCLSGL